MTILLLVEKSCIICLIFINMALAFSWFWCWSRSLDTSFIYLLCTFVTPLYEICCRYSVLELWLISFLSLVLLILAYIVSCLIWYPYFSSFDFYWCYMFTYLQTIVWLSFILSSGLSGNFPVSKSFFLWSYTFDLMIVF